MKIAYSMRYLGALSILLAGCASNTARSSSLDWYRVVGVSDTSVNCPVNVEGQSLTCMPLNPDMKLDLDDVDVVRYSGPISDVDFGSFCPSLPCAITGDGEYLIKEGFELNITDGDIIGISSDRRIAGFIIIKENQALLYVPGDAPSQRSARRLLNGLDEVRQ
jgi:hypothetical protein